MEEYKPQLDISPQELTLLARCAYDAYGATVQYRNYAGLPMPKWEQLPPRIKDAWEAAVTTVIMLSQGARDV